MQKHKRYITSAPVCRLSSKQEKANRIHAGSNPVGSAIMPDDLTEFKRMFWEWFDALPVEAKRSYQHSKIDVAEEYYREFFYQTDKHKR
jgi:hypothetical protein